MTTHFWAVPKIGTPAIQIDIDARRSAATIRCWRASTATPRSRSAHARGADRASAGKRKGWVGRRRQICQEWSREVNPLFESDAAQSGPSACVKELTDTRPTTPSWWSTPGMPACGWGSVGSEQRCELLRPLLANSLRLLDPGFAFAGAGALRRREHARQRDLGIAIDAREKRIVAADRLRIDVVWIAGVPIFGTAQKCVGGSGTRSARDRRAASTTRLSRFGANGAQRPRA